MSKDGQRTMDKRLDANKKNNKFFVKNSADLRFIVDITYPSLTYMQYRLQTLMITTSLYQSKCSLMGRLQNCEASFFKRLLYFEIMLQ